MEITNAVRLTVINELIDELEQYGGENASFRVKSCRQRLLARMEREAWREEHVVRHRTMSKATHDETGQMAREARA